MVWVDQDMVLSKARRTRNTEEWAHHEWTGPLMAPSFCRETTWSKQKPMASMPHSRNFYRGSVSPPSTDEFLGHPKQTNFEQTLNKLWTNFPNPPSCERLELPRVCPKGWGSRSIWRCGSCWQFVSALQWVSLKECLGERNRGDGKIWHEVKTGETCLSWTTADFLPMFIFMKFSLAMKLLPAESWHVNVEPRWNVDYQVNHFYCLWRFNDYLFHGQESSAAPAQWLWNPSDCLVPEQHKFIDA